MAQKNFSLNHVDQINTNGNSNNGYASTSILNKKPLLTSSFLKDNVHSNKLTNNGMFTKQITNHQNGYSDFKNPTTNSFIKNGSASISSMNGSLSSAFTSDIEKEFTDLTLSIEREMEKQQQQKFNTQQVENNYFNLCFKCSKPITKKSEACQAMGNVFHTACFLCVSCGRSLKNKPFYNINNNVYCEEDYLYSGFLENAEKCSVCGHIIVDMILQAIGKSYHPGCFRCSNCNDCLDGLPFTLDVNNKIYCIADYYKKYAPKCVKCKLPITPSDGSSETVRIVSMEKDFHVECYACEDCQIALSDDPQNRCYPIGDRLLCYDCHVKYIDADVFTKNILINSNNDNSITIDKKK